MEATYDPWKTINKHMKYKRILLKLSGEDLMGNRQYGIDPERLSDIRRNRINIMNETNLPSYTDLDSIKKEIEGSKKIFKKYNWPVIDVTRKSIEETAASVIKIYDIRRSKWK